MTTPFVGQKIRASDLALVFAPIVGFGERVSNGTTTTTVEKTYLRVDDISMTSGQAYEITSSPLIFESSVAADTIQVLIRISTSGAATTASTPITLLCQPSKTATSFQLTACLVLTYNALVTTTSASILMSYLRVTGTGNVRVNASSDIPAQLTVKWIGASKADGGVDL